MTKAYQRRTGSIAYAALATIADIAHAASLLSCFNRNPAQEHIKAADHCIRYLLEHAGYALHFSADTKELSMTPVAATHLRRLNPVQRGAAPEPLVRAVESCVVVTTDTPGQEVSTTDLFLQHDFAGASDASFADDGETRCSSEGMVFHLFGTPVD